MGSTITLNDKLVSYIEDHTSKEPELYRRLREETLELGSASEMQISWIQGCFMQLLVRLMGARKYLEVGVFTGYSTLAVAEALPEGGTITALDISEEWTSLGARYWQEAGVDGKIDLRLEDAIKALGSLLEGGAEGSYDLAFIDADKENMADYFNYCLKLLRPGGMVSVDNVLWGGDVINPEDQRESTIAIRSFNKKILKDERVFYSFLPVGDGLILAQKK